MHRRFRPVCRAVACSTEQAAQPSQEGFGLHPTFLPRSLSGAPNFFQTLEWSQE